MSVKMLRVLSVIVIFILGLCITSTAESAEVALDLIAPWGDFEPSAISYWGSYYNGNDYDFKSNTISCNKDGDGRKSCVSLSTFGNTLAYGWSCEMSASIHPKANVVSDVIKDTATGKYKQFFCVKDLPIGTKFSLSLVTSPQSLGKTWGVVPGNQVTFRIDEININDADGVNGGFILCITSNGRTIKTKSLNPKSSTFADEVSAIIPTDTKSIGAFISIYGKITDQFKKPGITISGAHLYTKIVGKAAYNSITVPVAKERNIKTFKLVYDSRKEDDLHISSNYDYLIWSATNNPAYIKRLRYLNPDLKCYIYTSSRIQKTSGNSNLLSACGVDYNYASTHNPEWLYTDSTKSKAHLNDQIYNQTYWTRIENRAYADKWAANIIEKARLTNYDGIFIDDIVSANKKNENGNVVIPERLPWAQQTFLHNIMQKLNAAGIDVILNQGSLSLSKGESPVYFNPFWTKQAPYNTAEYNDNSISTTPRIYFNEGAFFYYAFPSYSGPIFNKIYWKQCIDNMDTIAEYNKSIKSAKDQRLYFAYLEGGNDTKKASGINGWLQFGLGSYLLAQNEWTALGFDKKKDEQTLDFSITKKLGDPIGVHTPINGDIYFQYRKYKSNENGGRGGIVLVNANNSTSRDYMLDFDGMDENGQLISSKSNIKLLPNTARIIFHR